MIVMCSTLSNSSWHKMQIAYLLVQYLCFHLEYSTVLIKQVSCYFGPKLLGEVEFYSFILIKIGSPKALICKVFIKLVTIWNIFNDALSRRMRFKIYNTIIKLMVLYGCESWCLILRENQQKLQALENTV